MALVQTTGKLQADNVSTSTTFSSVLATSPVAGNTLFFVVNQYQGAGTISAVTIGGKSATLEVTQEYAGGSARVQIWRTAAAGAGANTDVVVDYTNGSNYITGAAFEYSDVVDTDPLDVSTGTTGTSAAPAVTLSSSTTSAGALIIAQWGDGVGEAALGSSTPASTGYTSLYVEQNSIDHQGGEASYKEVSTTAAHDASWTRSNSGAWAAIIAAYELDGGAPGEEALTGSAMAAAAGIASSAHVNPLSGAAVTTAAGTVAPFQATEAALAGAQASTQDGALGSTHANLLVGTLAATTAGTLAAQTDQNTQLLGTAMAAASGLFGNVRQVPLVTAAADYAASVAALPANEDVITTPVIAPETIQAGLAVYSRFSLSNIDDTLLTIFGENSTSAVIIDMETHATVDTLGSIGEVNDLRWDYTSPDHVFYLSNMSMFRRNVRTGSTVLVRDFATDFPDGDFITMDGEGDSSNDSRYWCFMVMDIVEVGSYPCVAIFTYDRVADVILGELRPADIGQPELRRPNMTEVSPDGQWAMINDGRSYVGWFEHLIGTVEDGPHFWPMDLNPAGAVRACPDETHSGWALDAAGNPMFCYQNNINDWIEAIYPGDEYMPDGSNQIRIANQSNFDTDFGMGWHFAKAYNVRGYMLLSTYSSSDNDWADNQNYFYPLAANSTPHRLGPNLTEYPGNDAYRNESPAAWSYSGRYVHWHTNFGVGSGTRTVVQVDLGEQPGGINTQALIEPGSAMATNDQVLAGVQTLAIAGTLTAQGDTTAALAGLVASAQAGTLVPEGTSTAALTGEGVAAATGTLVAQVEESPELAGQQVAVAAGVVTVASARAVMGLQTTAVQGTVLTDSDAAAAVFGQQATTMSGVLAMAPREAALAGLPLATALGALGSAQTVLGAQVAVTAGLLLPTTSRALVGTQAVSIAGTIGTHGATGQELVGQSMTSAAGYVVVTPDLVGGSFIPFFMH